MNEANARTILRRFEAVRPAPTPTLDRRWRWAAGVHLFPEAVCPFCKVVMRSSCIWQVDERAQRLTLIAKPVGSLLQRVPNKHPHIRSDGSVCMDGHAPRTGGASNVAEALFLGIYPMSTMGGFGRNKSNPVWAGWFKDYWDHPTHDEAGLRKRRRPALKLGRVRKARSK